MRAHERLRPRLANHNALHAREAAEGAKTAGTIASTDELLVDAESWLEIFARRAFVRSPWFRVKVL
jgi:hypothetical protein